MSGFSIRLFSSLFLFCSLSAYSDATEINTNTTSSQSPLPKTSLSKQSEADSLYFAQKKDLLTATWDKPFDYESIKSNHAPLGPYMGNGDVGVVAYTSGNSQTLKISKVDFVTDGWSDWAGSGPSALPVGGLEISVDSPASSGFLYQMDQLANELRMTVMHQNKQSPNDGCIKITVTEA